MIIAKALEVAANDVGPISTTSHLAARKTIIATDVEGHIVIEASADGVHFSDVATITGPYSEAVIEVAASHMRVRADGTASSVNVVAEQGLIRSARLQSSVIAPGPAVDVSSFGSTLTFFVKAGGPVGSIVVQISADNINWARFKTFTTSGCNTEDVSTRFIRAVSHNPTFSVAVASDSAATRALNSPARAFVFRPGGTAGENVYTDWTDLVAAMSSVQGRKMLEFDDSISQIRLLRSEATVDRASPDWSPDGRNIAVEEFDCWDYGPCPRGIVIVTTGGVYSTTIDDASEPAWRP